MKYVLALSSLFLVLAYVTAAPPILPGLDDTGVNLSPKCQIPKCPDTKNQQELQIPVTLPYPFDCLQFIACNGTEGRIIACPPNTAYDKTKGICAPQETVKCVLCYQE